MKEIGPRRDASLAPLDPPLTSIFYIFLISVLSIEHVMLLGAVADT